MKTRIVWMLGVLLMAVVLAACGEATPSPAPVPTATPLVVRDTPTATPTDVPTPTPATPTTPTPEPATPSPTPMAVATPTPEPSPSLIVIAEDTTWQEIFDDLGATEQACILADVEDIESGLNDHVMTDAAVPMWWQVSFFACLDPATARSLFFSIFVTETLAADFQITDGQVVCLSERMEGVDVMRTIEGMASEDPAALGEMMSRFVPCLSDFFVSEILGEAGIDIADLTDAERDCLDEWMADLDWSSVMATDDAMPAFMGGLFNCVPEAALAMFLDDDMGSLTDEESDCALELVGNVDWAALDDEADFIPLVLGLFNCIPASVDKASLEGFMVTSTTVGGELADAVSWDEASCLEEGIGDSAYQAFRARTLAESGRDTANVRALYNCLTEDNFLTYGVGVTQVWAGGWSAETQACSIALAREHPEFIYVRIGLEEEATTTHEADVYLLDFYDCLNDEEKITFTLRTFAGPGSVGPSALVEILAFIPESEASCILDTVGVTREQLPQRMAEAGSGFMSEIVSAAGACMSQDTSVNIFVADTGRVLGGLSDQSRTCLKAFGMEHFHFLELIAGGEAAARAMPAEVAAEIADDGSRMVQCFNDDELLALQRLMAGVLRQSGDSGAPGENGQPGTRDSRFTQ